MTSECEWEATNTEMRMYCRMHGLAVQLCWVSGSLGQQSCGHLQIHVVGVCVCVCVHVLEEVGGGQEKRYIARLGLCPAWGGSVPERQRDPLFELRKHRGQGLPLEP